jgi:hypothetical protein
MSTPAAPQSKQSVPIPRTKLPSPNQKSRGQTNTILNADPLPPPAPDRFPSVSGNPAENQSPSNNVILKRTFLTMKYSVFSATILTFLASNAMAGTRTSGTQTTSQQSSRTLAFGASETQIEVFDTYLDGKGPDHAGPFREHGTSGVVDLNHFWLENVGFGVDVAGIHERENPSLRNSSKTLVQSTTSLINAPASRLKKSRRRG